MQTISKELLTLMKVIKIDDVIINGKLLHKIL